MLEEKENTDLSGRVRQWTERVEKNAGTLIVFALLMFWLAAFLSKPVSLINTDLGRHIENGRYFLETHHIPDTNLFSYTYPDVPFINHHWGSGVIFYLIWKASGFSGLAFFSVALGLATFGLLFFTAKRFAGLAIATLSAVLAIPLIGERTEVRPEVFSYFLAVVFFALLWRFKAGRLRQRFLYVLPLLMLIWINLHIYFIFGLGLIGLFLLDSLIGRRWEQTKTLLGVLLLSGLASLLNPFGLKAVFYPLNIFRNYGYTVLENQSISYIDRLGFIDNPNILVFKIILLALIASQILLFVTNRRRTDWVMLGLGVTVSVLGWSALRNFTLFGCFALPILAYNLRYALVRKIDLHDGWVRTGIFCAAGLAALLLGFIDQSKFLAASGNVNSDEVVKAQEASADFFRENSIKGPIFNNYDIGSFLTFELYPREKVFVDNRPEAYPDDFFQKVYIPMQEDQAVWKQVEGQYQFNAIYFYLGDLTNWGQAFLVRTIDDPEWAPVFTDGYSIIFLRRNDENRGLIARFEIPRDRFGVTKT